MDKCDVSGATAHSQGYVTYSLGPEQPTIMERSLRRFQKNISNLMNSFDRTLPGINKNQQLYNCLIFTNP